MRIAVAVITLLVAAATNVLSAPLSRVSTRSNVYARSNISVFVSGSSSQHVPPDGIVELKYVLVVSTLAFVLTID